MSRLRVDYEFQVEGLWVFDEVGGQAVNFDRAGRGLTVSFPSHVEGDTGDERAYGSASETTPKGTARPLRRFTVGVTVESGVDASEIRRSSEAREWAHELKLTLFELARGVAAELVDQIRVRHDQPWLSPHPPRLVATRLVDTADEEPLPVGWAPPLTVFVGAGTVAIDASALTGPIRTALGEAAYPGVAEILLADARHHAIRADIKHEAAISLLLTAIAVEVKSKQTLRERVLAERLPLLDVVMDNPRDVTVAAATLLDRVAKAALGRSLREDDLALFKRVDVLFQKRNAFAHRAAYPSETEARDGVDAARAVFAWLDSLLGSSASPPSEGGRP